MTGRSVAEKMGLRSGLRGLLVDAPADAVRALQLPDMELQSSPKGRFDYIHLFVRSSEALDETFPRLKPHLASDGRFWVSWPKGGKAPAFLTLKEVIRIGYAHGLVESTCLSVNDTWSALKFTHPIKGKTYRNSYGKLPNS